MTPHRADRARAAGRARQRGAIGLVGAVTLLLAFVFAALSIDSGRLWLERRSLQRTADMAALEAARYTGCGSTPNDALAAATASATRNGLPALKGGQAIELQRGRISTDAASMRQFTPSPDDDDMTDAVRVQVFKSVPSSLVLGGLLGGELLLSAEATAQGSPPVTAFALGSAVLAVNPSSQTIFNGLLGGLLGTNLDVSLLSYQGLATAKVDLASMLKLQAGVATPNDLLELRMGLGDAIDLMGRASNEQQALTPEVSLGLSKIIQAANLSGRTIRLGDVLSVGTPSAPALAGLNVNLLNLVVASIQIGGPNSDGYFNLPVSVKGIGAVQVKLGAKPAFAIGPAGRSNRPGGGWCTEAKTSAMEVSVQVDAVDGVAKFLQTLTLGIISLDFDFKVKVVGGLATAHPHRIQLAAGTSHVEMGVMTGVMSLFISNRAETGPAVMGVTILGKRTGVEIHFDPSNQQTGFTNLDIPIDTPIEDNLPQRGQGSANASGAIASLIGKDSIHMQLNLLGFEVPMDKLAESLIQGLVGLIGPILDPILQITGLQLGAAIVDVVYLDGGQPQLVR